MRILSHTAVPVRNQALQALTLCAVLLTGCVTGKQPDIVLKPEMTPQLVKARQHATVCEHPILAHKTISPKFSYGCFCGEGYPDIRDPSNRKSNGLSREERYALIVKFYAIRPVDEIDSACQAHDVCYILNGGREYWCDSALSDDLANVEKQIKPLVDTFEMDTPEWRCQQLASDIGMAATTVFPSGSQQWLMGLTMRTFKIMFSPITGLYALTTIGAWDDYPKGKFCRLEDLKAGNVHHNFWQQRTLTTGQD